MINYVLFDAAGTLIVKPALFTTLQKVIRKTGSQPTLDEIKKKHKILSEIIPFPDKTSRNFYRYFNAELLCSLGILPRESLVDSMITACASMRWEAAPDTAILQKLDLPMGILSNFHGDLKKRIDRLFPGIFRDFFVSANLGIAKPDKRIFQEALKKICLPADQVLYVGDSFKLDLAPAQSLGMQALLIDRDGFYPKLNQKISNLGQIAKRLR